MKLRLTREKERFSPVIPSSIDVPGVEEFTTTNLSETFQKTKRKLKTKSTTKYGLPGQCNETLNQEISSRGSVVSYHDHQAEPSRTIFMLDNRNEYDLAGVLNDANARITFTQLFTINSIHHMNINENDSNFLTINTEPSNDKNILRDILKMRLKELMSLEKQIISSDKDTNLCILLHFSDDNSSYDIIIDRHVHKAYCLYIDPQHIHSYTFNNKTL
ncbi:hypothetical protein H8356DRAFT_1336249 [Neocallimastix lanati (nom. inval.)]|nr:hypothetical protein H8356DRAFT_1336249 [Neocallimastix sp. JGI-2020a]